MKTSESKFPLKYFLYISISLYILQIIIRLVFYSYSRDESQGPFMNELSKLPSFLIAFFLLVFAPIVEELLFRGWIKKKPIWKNISYIGICVASFLAVGSVLYLCVSAVILFYLYYILKDGNLKLIFLVLATSFSFTIIHVESFPNGIAEFVSIFGMLAIGILLSYLGLRFNFIYCVFAHFLLNLISVLVLMFASPDYSGKIDAPNYSATIAKDAKIKFGYTNYIYPDVVYQEGSLAKIAHALCIYNRDTIYKYSPSIFNDYKYEALPKYEDTLSNRDLFNDLVSHANLRLDITKENAYVLKIVDSLKLTDIKNPEIAQTEYSLDYFVEVLRVAYDLPVIIDELDSKFKIYRHESFSNLDYYGKSKKDYLSFIQKNYGLILEEDSLKKAVVITISETMD